VLIAEWVNSARCVGMNPVLFEVTAGIATPEAVSACLSCPVRAECLADAVQAADDTMVRAGLTPDERRRARLGYTIELARRRGNSLAAELLLKLEIMHQEGKSSREIAEALDIPARTVRYRIAKLDPNRMPAPSRTSQRDRKRERTHCLHGHLWTLENTRIDEKGYRRCVRCQRWRTQASNIKRGMSRADVRTHCRNGHEKTPENVKVKTNGDKVCRLCAHVRYIRHRDSKENTQSV
jgi:WhiB family redox-sensing transcriptional regulator